jgi:hypothetical protein
MIEQCTVCKTNLNGEHYAIDTFKFGDDVFPKSVSGIFFPICKDCIQPILEYMNELKTWQRKKSKRRCPVCGRKGRLQRRSYTMKGTGGKWFGIKPLPQKYKCKGGHEWEK